MTRIQYSINCYYKNDLYRLSIVVNSDGDADDLSEISDPFTGTDILPEQIKPTLTQINFELTDPYRKSSALPQSIRLNQLLNVVYVKSVTNRQEKQAFTSDDTLNTKSISREAIEESQETLYTMLKKSRSDVNVKQQSSWGSHLSRQTTVNNSRPDFTRISSVRLSYVDVSNSIHWSIKKVELKFDTETMAVDLYRNLNVCLTTLIERPRYLLVFVNPCCGKGRLRGSEKNFQ